jgi:hypothetical protein
MLVVAVIDVSQVGERVEGGHVAAGRFEDVTVLARHLAGAEAVTVSARRRRFHGPPEFGLPHVQGGQRRPRRKGGCELGDFYRVGEVSSGRQREAGATELPVVALQDDGERIGDRAKRSA